MTKRIATWNINSVRLRLPLVERFLTEQSPDVLCLQEIKCRQAEFPSSAFTALGYTHIALNGQKGYHGVAIVSRLPIADISTKEFCDKGDARHVSATFASGVLQRDQTVLHNFYIPAGGDIPDRELNEKFAHKLDFLDELTAWTMSHKLAGENAILVGDLNIAPLETDVWSHKALLKIVSHTPVEVERMKRLLEAGPWVDAMRTLVPEPEQLYTWWSYRAANWELANKGRRLDHIWLSQNLAPNLKSMTILKDARGWERPSDHVPVIVDLED
jgi:exodeoxyribonuclease-3